ncbi:MAG: hypothetical protein MJZ87_09420 [Bacteroidales bacterium]|nr:hypothetical protein [Bacteroidales bacterium]
MEDLKNYYFIATQQSKLSNLYWDMEIGENEPDFFQKVNCSGVIGYNQGKNSFEEIRSEDDLENHHVFLIFDNLCDNDEFSEIFNNMKNFINKEDNSNKYYLLKHKSTGCSIIESFPEEYLIEGSHINSPEYVYPKILSILIEGIDVENKIDEYFMSLND